MAHILIVDDSPTEIHVLRSILEAEGHQISVAGTGEEAVQVTPQIMPDLILMDIVMPGMNGFQATRQLSKSEVTANIPVIVVTTKDQDTDRMWSLRQGAKDFLTKPVDAEELLTKVNGLLG